MPWRLTFTLGDPHGRFGLHGSGPRPAGSCRSSSCPSPARRTSPSSRPRCAASSRWCRRSASGSPPARASSARPRRPFPRCPPRTCWPSLVARNTAPAIGLAAATIAREDPDAIVVVLPADHFIGDEPEFRKILARAIDAASNGWLTTIGIVPTRAETGYGYIEIGDRVSEGVHAAARFIEKPSKERAAELVAGKRHLWNAGMFFFRASVMLDAIGKHLPDLARGLRAHRGRGEEGRGREGARREEFPKMPSILIDNGVMEKADKIAVVPGSFGWNDVGSWETTWEMSEKDAAGNALPAGSVAVDATNNLVKDLTRGRREEALGHRRRERPRRRRDRRRDPGHAARARPRRPPRRRRRR